MENYNSNQNGTGQFNGMNPGDGNWQQNQQNQQWQQDQQNQQWQQNQQNQQWQQNQQNQQWQQNPQWQQPEKQGLAIASLVLGVISILCCYFYGGVLGIIGLILGIVSRAKKQGGKGMAIGGIITSAIGMVIFISQMIAVIALLNWGYENMDLTMDELVEAMEELEEYDDYEYDIDDYDYEYDIDDDYEIDDDFDDEYDIDDDYDYDVEEYDFVYGEAANGADDFVGESYRCGDGSVIYFEEDGTYIWYQDDTDHTDNYYVGTYELYFGEDATDYIVNDLVEYGITQDEMDEYLEMNSGDGFYTEDNLVCMMLFAEQAIIDGEDQADGGYVSPYMGFMQYGYFDATNMNTANYVSFYAL